MFLQVSPSPIFSKNELLKPRSGGIRRDRGNNIANHVFRDAVNDFLKHVFTSKFIKFYSHS
jgi:hypothetical protein